MNENDFRDVAAMFAMMGILIRGGYNPQLLPKEGIAREAYSQADAMIEARNKEPEPEVGIVAAKTRRKK